MTPRTFVTRLAGAIPHTDVGNSPGFTHRSGRRIGQLDYKGAGVHNRSTRVVSSWPAGFTSDHYLIRSVFELR